MNRATVAWIALAGTALLAQASAATHSTQTLLPASVDWRTWGAVTPVEDQGQCGASWAFAAVASLEGAVRIAGGSLVALSAQQLIDCSGSHGNSGCHGGMADTALAYVHSHGGLASEGRYPYTARDGTCKANAVPKVAFSRGFREVAHSEDALLAAVALQPVAVMIHASDESFLALGPGAGVVPCFAGTPDLWVTIVGYGTDLASGKNYWLIKNSWGPYWGDAGYARIERGLGCRDIHGAVHPALN